MTLGVLALLLAVVCAVALSSRVTPASRDNVERWASTPPAALVLCSWWPEVETRPG